MEILLILTEFFIIYTITKSLNKKESNIVILIKSILIISFLVVFLTEILNILKLINYSGFVLSWILTVFLSIIFLIKRTNKENWCPTNLNRIAKLFAKIPKLHLFFIIGIIILLLFQGLLYPPNNWDSMTYHMARITNWIGNESINHYPTHIYRQLYQPPFSSFFILHLSLLTSHDYFSNSVQLFYLLGSVVTIIAILDLFDSDLKTKILAIILTLTIPEVLLQASSTQNDIVVSFFILTCSFFCLKTYKHASITNFSFLGISIGLALLSKATAYIYLAPILLLFGFYLIKDVINRKTTRTLIYSLIVIALATLINLGHYFRNYELSGSFLGVDNNESKMYSNQSLTPKLLFLNLLKNGSLHFGPFPLNKISEKATIMTHNILEVETNNPETSYLGMEYHGAPSSPNHEDTAPNFFHFYLILISLAILLINLIDKKRNRESTIILLIVFLLQITFFCGYLKWQIWNSRIHTPLFLMSIPMVIFSFSTFPRVEILLKKFLPLFMLFAVFIVIFTRARPFVTTSFTHKISIVDERYRKYFANQPELYPEYNNIVSILISQQNQKIGLILYMDDWEYPLFSNLMSKGVFPQHIKVENISNSIPKQDSEISFIVSTKNNEPMIDYNGISYQNITNDNKKIWLYRIQK